MKRILLTGSGGSPTTNVVRSLRTAGDDYFLVGLDADRYNVHRSETDVTYLAPPCSHPKYADFVNHIVERHDLEFLHVQNDAEMEVVSEMREQLKIATFLPAKQTVQTCINKFAAQKKWEDAGLKVPKSRMIHTPQDLREAFEEYNGKVWVREISGAGGRGSLAPKDYEQAEVWLNFKSGWGKFIAAELLSPDSVTWMSIWKDGELIVAQGRKRLYWELSKISPSGVTGATGAGVTHSDPALDDIAFRTVKSIDDQPNGIFSVDLTYDFSGVPNPTEINIGRFFTTSEFFSRAGLNMAEIYLKVAAGEPLPALDKKVNPLPEGLTWIRGMDFLPVLVDVHGFGVVDATYQEILSKL